MSLHAKPHTSCACVFSCSLPPAPLAKWPGNFMCYCGNLTRGHHKNDVLETGDGLLRSYRPSRWRRTSLFEHRPPCSAENVQAYARCPSTLYCPWSWFFCARVKTRVEHTSRTFLPCRCRGLNVLRSHAEFPPCCGMRLNVFRSHAEFPQVFVRGTCPQKSYWISSSLRMRLDVPRSYAEFSQVFVWGLMSSCWISSSLRVKLNVLRSHAKFSQVFVWGLMSSEVMLNFLKSLYEA